MSGYAYGEKEPEIGCPYCGATCRADFVDVGVGYVQCGPYHCEVCNASEIGPYDRERDLTDREKELGWYAPGSEPGSSANVVDGRVVCHQEMRARYRRAFYGNPTYDIPGAVQQWLDETRRSKP
ncbi:TPA: hypothetical protein NID01_000534 [Pseudomonas aeruginosa]|nr:hypothetical protein [Pseudomonas aeruginosa]